MSKLLNQTFLAFTEDEIEERLWREHISDVRAAAGRLGGKRQTAAQREAFARARDIGRAKKRATRAASQSLATKES